MNKSKLSAFSDDEICQEYDRRLDSIRKLQNLKKIKKAKFVDFTYKDVVIFYPRKENFEKDVHGYNDAYFFFMFKQKSGELIDFYSAVSEYDQNDDDGYEKVSEFVPSGFGEAAESCYDFNGEAPEDYEGFLKTVIEYLRSCGYDDIRENPYDQ